jgi:hypothetical protein
VDVDAKTAEALEVLHLKQHPVKNMSSERALAYSCAFALAQMAYMAIH